MIRVPRFHAVIDKAERRTAQLHNTHESTYNNCTRQLTSHTDRTERSTERPLVQPDTARVRTTRQLFIARAWHARILAYMTERTPSTERATKHMTQLRRAVLEAHRPSDTLIMIPSAIDDMSTIAKDSAAAHSAKGGRISNRRRRGSRMAAEVGIAD